MDETPEIIIYVDDTKWNLKQKSKDFDSSRRKRLIVDLIKYRTIHTKNYSRLNIKNEFMNSINKYLSRPSIIMYHLL
jgi:hypothetical protein